MIPLELDRPRTACTTVSLQYMEFQAFDCPCIRDTDEVMSSTAIFKYDEYGNDRRSTDDWINLQIYSTLALKPATVLYVPGNSGTPYSSIRFVQASH